MPAWQPDRVTQQVAQRIRTGLTEPVLIAVSGQPGRVRRAEAAIAPEIELQVVEIEPSAEQARDVGGTLVVPVAAESLADADPRSLARGAARPETL